MRRLVTLVITCMAALLVLAAPPASAGGPTSVLIVNYDGSRAAGALTGSKAYEDLIRALDAMNTPAGESTPPAGIGEARLRLTWMIHDVTPWRFDAVAIDGDDVWVNTAMTTDGTHAGPGTWHRAADGRLLVATLNALGVGPSSSSAPSAAPPAAAGVSDPPSATAPSPVTLDRASGTTPIEWSIALAGALAALCAGLLLGRRSRGNRTRERDLGPWPADSVELTPRGRSGAG